MSVNSSNRSANDVVIIGGARTAFSRFGGALKSSKSVDLAAFAISRAIERSGVSPHQVNEVNVGVTTLSEVAFDGPVMARVALLKAGLPEATRSMTIDRACCSSMAAVHLATGAIMAGSSNIAVAAGVDNMGRAAFLLSGETRYGHRRGSIVLKDPMSDIGADVLGQPVACDVGEVAVEYGITREEQDDWAFRSHERYGAAHAAGFFAGEIVPTPYADERGHEGLLEQDEQYRSDISLDALRRLPTVLGSLTVTAGNSPGINAGATALVLTRRSIADELGLPVLATVRATHAMARTPREMAVAPAPSLAAVIEKAGWQLRDVDVLEVNEAFAAVPLVVARELGGGDRAVENSVLDRTNVNGGAVAIGHPPGASGARLVLTAARELERRGGGRGAVSICGGLAQADSVALSVP